MESFSYVGFLVIIGIVFIVLRLSDNKEAKDEGKPAESSKKLFWVAIVSVLAFLGFMVVTGDLK